ncbi:MAG: hypothetical protein AAGM38_11375 [Pseudomonadota bacterium]
MRAALTKWLAFLVGSAALTGALAAALIPVVFARALAGLLAAVLAAPAAHAHPFHSGVVVSITGAKQADDSPDIVEMGLSIVNLTEGAVTLRGLRAPVPSRFFLERRREVFSAVLWQPVAFLRLESGETAHIGPRGLRLRVRTRAPELFTSGRLLLMADFGPLGEIAAYDQRYEMSIPSLSAPSG